MMEAEEPLSPLPARDRGLVVAKQQQRVDILPQKKRDVVSQKERIFGLKTTWMAPVVLPTQNYLLNLAEQQQRYAFDWAEKQDFHSGFEIQRDLVVAGGTWHHLDPSAAMDAVEKRDELDRSAGDCMVS